VEDAESVWCAPYLTALAETTGGRSTFMGLLGPLEEFWRLMDLVLAPQRHPNTDAGVKHAFVNRRRWVWR
jgi:hypothetical protein